MHRSASASFASGGSFDPQPMDPSDPFDVDATSLASSDTLSSSPPRLRRRPSLDVDFAVLQELLDECDAKLAQDACNLHWLAIRGHAWMKLKHWDMAIHDFSRFLNQRPFDVHKRFSRGMAYFKNGQTQEAYDDFTKVLQVNPNHVMARYARASCFNTVGQFNHAIHEYTIALRKDARENEKRLVMHLPKTKLQSQQHQHQPTKLYQQQLQTVPPLPKPSANPPKDIHSQVHFQGATIHSNHAVSDQTTILPTSFGPEKAINRAKRKSKRRSVHKVTINLSEFAMPTPVGSPMKPLIKRPSSSPTRSCSSVQTSAVPSKGGSSSSLGKVNTPSVCATCGQQVPPPPHPPPPCSPVHQPQGTIVQSHVETTCAVTTAATTTNGSASSSSSSPNEKEVTKKKKVIVLRRVTVAL